MAVRRDFNHFPAIRRDLERRVTGVIKVAMFNIREHALDAMAESKTGRVYPVPGVAHTVEQGWYTASAPGEAPAILFGQLANSIDGELLSPTRGRVFSTAEYAPHLEFGTIDMAPRPFFEPAAAEEEPEYRRALKSLLGSLGGRGSISGPMSR